MTAPPLISIVTPCRNGAGRLRRALESVVQAAAGAGEGRIEHIIIDGASTDGSAEVIAEHAAANPGLVSFWVSEPDSGQSEAINRGMGRARGRFGAWLNADDWYEPGVLGAIAERLERPDAPDVLIGRCRFVDDEGRVLMEPRPPEPLSLANLLRLRTQWFAGRCMVQPEVFFRRDRFWAVGGLDARNHYTMDHDLWCRLMIAGLRFETADVRVACLRIHAGQKTRDNREVARSMLGHARPLALAARAHLGAEYAEVCTELGAVGEKLRIADDIIRWWRRGLDPAAPRVAIKPEDQPLPPVGAEEGLRTVARAARRALRWRRSLRIALLECDPHTAAAALRALGRRPAELHLAARSRLVLSQTSALLRDSVRSRTIRAHVGRLEGGTLDLIIVQGVSARSIWPRAALGELWSRLAPGGVLLQLDDPLRSPELARYIDFLSMRLGDLITANHDLLLHPTADEVLRRISVAPPPAVAGIDPRDIFPRLDAAAKCLASHRYGTCEDHPLTPFVALGQAELNGFASWVSSAWQRPGAT